MGWIFVSREIRAHQAETMGVPIPPILRHVSGVEPGHVVAGPPDVRNFHQYRGYPDTRSSRARSSEILTGHSPREPGLLKAAQIRIRDTVRQFAERELAPGGSDRDRICRFPRDPLAKMAELG